MAVVDVTDPNHGEANRPTHPWGSYVSSYIISANTFRISFYNLSTQSCVALESAVVNPQSSSGPVGVGSWYTGPPVNGQQGQSYGASTYVDLTTGINFDATMAAAMCGGSAGDPAASGAVSAEFDFSTQ